MESPIVIVESHNRGLVNADALLICLVLTFFGFVSVGSSQTSNSATAEKPIKTELIEVSLDNGGQDWKLCAGKSMPLVIVVRNLTDKSLKLRHLPVFSFVRQGSDEESPRHRENFSGRLDIPSIPRPVGVMLAPHEQLILKVDLSQVEVLDQWSSIDVWDKVLMRIPNGPYYLFVDAVVDLSTVSQERFEHSFSARNLLVISGSKVRP